MSKNSPKKVAKKREREQRVKEKLMVRREKVRAKAKEEYQKEKDAIEARRVANRLKGVTIRNNRSSEEVVDQLSHNYEILKALEAEHEAMKEQQKNANQLNVGNIPEEFLLKPNVPEKKGFKASADVVFTPNPEPAPEVKETNESGN